MFASSANDPAHPHRSEPAMKIPRSRLALLPLLWLAVAASRPSTPQPFHLHLERSAPAADSVVAPPSEIRLWFSEATDATATSIRVTDAGGRLAATGKLEPSEDGKVVRVGVEGTLTDGPYTVSWRTIGDDGHVVRGDFAFTVRAARP